MPCSAYAIMQSMHVGCIMLLFVLSGACQLCYLISIFGKCKDTCCDSGLMGTFGVQFDQSLEARDFCLSLAN